MSLSLSFSGLAENSFTKLAGPVRGATRSRASGAGRAVPRSRSGFRKLCAFWCALSAAACCTLWLCSSMISSASARSLMLMRRPTSFMNVCTRASLPSTCAVWASSVCPAGFCCCSADSTAAAAESHHVAACAPRVPRSARRASYRAERPPHTCRSGACGTSLPMRGAACAARETAETTFASVRNNFFCLRASCHPPTVPVSAPPRRPAARGTPTLLKVE